MTPIATAMSRAASQGPPAQSRRRVHSAKPRWRRGTARRAHQEPAHAVGSRRCLSWQHLPARVDVGGSRLPTSSVCSSRICRLGKGAGIADAGRRDRRSCDLLWRERASMRRTFCAGVVLAVAAVLVVSSARPFDLELESVALLGARPRRRRRAGARPHAAGPARRLRRRVRRGLGRLRRPRAALLPDTAGGRAVAVGLVVLLCVADRRALTHDRLPLWTALLGTAALAGAYEFTYAAAPPRAGLDLGQHRDHAAAQRRRRLPRRRPRRPRSPGGPSAAAASAQPTTTPTRRRAARPARRLHDGEDQVTHAPSMRPHASAPAAARSASCAPSAGAPAAAADGSGDVDVVNTETVQVYTSPTGDVETSGSTSSWP